MHRGVNRAEATRRTSRRIVKQAASAGARAPRKSVASAAAMDILKPMVNQKIGLGTEDALDGTFRALADPARRAILARLARGEASVSELARPLTMSLPAVMQHLGVLEQCGLVRSSKRGRVRTCRLSLGSLRRAQRWIAGRCRDSGRGTDG